MSRLGLLSEFEQVQTAIELIELGARVQTLEDITDINRGRLVRLYKEVRGEAPAKGMLPYSTDWFATWKPNIHSSLFLSFYNRIKDLRGITYSRALATAYRLYSEQVLLNNHDDDGLVLTFTRAWMLTRFIESNQLETCSCTSCQLPFITLTYTLTDDFVCGLCLPPSRAGVPLGKTKKASVTPIQSLAS